MKTYFKILLFTLLSFSALNAQVNNVKEHKVSKGETVYQIAKKYQVTPFDIYRLNPDAKEGIEENSILLIPSSLGEVKNNPIKADSSKKHKVLPKETLYSIAKMYEVSVADLKEWNEADLKEGLKIGQEIIVSVNYAPINNSFIEVKEVKTVSTVSSHVVKMQETKYGISKKYNISIEELERLNPQIQEGLEVGQILKIKENNEIVEIQNTQSNNFYAVKPGETLYSLTKKLNVTEAELTKLNPEITLGFKEGMVLKLPASVNLIAPKKEVKDLLPLVVKTKKRNLVLLLPFNMNKIESDSLKTKSDYLKNDKFLNLTLDFYSGALMAIDSAKVLGLPVHVKILDVESSKSTSNVAQLISKNNFSNVDAVIGPFMYTHVENTAQLLLNNKIPVISPLSKETGASLENLYYSVPSQENMIKTMFAYIEQKKGNVIAIVNSKKTSSKDFLEKNYPFVQYPKVKENGFLDLDDFKSRLVKGQKNFIILETENASAILQATNTLLKWKEEFDIQLVVLELYSALDFEGIPVSNLTELNMLFPSSKRELNTDAGRIFKKKYKNKNNVNPNAYAIKGFDLTFDTLLRICQEEGFVNSIKNTKTEQAANSFDYIVQEGKNVNNGIYIMYYDNDLTIKQAQ
uniref:LysM peptidoglycan-binding domain-containing protein n=1 Tax=Flavobacterium sp. TaxID=239 RepID=UPI004049FBA4